MNSETQRTFEWYEFIPHVLAVIMILCCVIVFAASFTGLAVLQFNWIQRTCLAVGAVVLVIMLLRWIGQDQQAVRMAQAAARPAKAPEAAKAPFEYMEFRVAGVSFPNDDGVDRQELLRAYRFGDAPFDKEKRITLRDLEFEGKPAFQVLANGQCIGWVPKNEVPELVEKWDQLDRVTDFDVTGGGFDSDTDEKLCYGATLSIRFFS
mgnify:FL=1